MNDNVLPFLFTGCDAALMGLAHRDVSSREARPHRFPRECILGRRSGSVSTVSVLIAQLETSNADIVNLYYGRSTNVVVMCDCFFV